MAYYLFTCVLFGVCSVGQTHGLTCRLAWFCGVQVCSRMMGRKDKVSIDFSIKVDIYSTEYCHRGITENENLFFDSSLLRDLMNVVGVLSCTATPDFLHLLRTPPVH